MKLWQKENTSLSKLIEQFTVGKDKEFDLLLAEYDVQGSIAHVTMLGEVGLMTKEESSIAVNALHDILKEINPATGCTTFKIDENVEDVHSQIELLLTQRIGDTGKKFIVAEAAMTRLR